MHDRLLLDLSEEEAAARFGQLIHESINSSLSTQVAKLTNTIIKYETEFVKSHKIFLNICMNIEYK